MGKDIKCDVRCGREIHRGIEFTDVMAKLSSGILAFHSEACVPGSENWVALMQFPDFCPFIASKLKLAATGLTTESLFNNWFVKDRQSSLGPFSLLQMLEFHNQKRIRLGTMIHHSTMQDWEAFGTLNPFDAKSLASMLAQPEIIDLITRRKHPRIRYSNEVFLSTHGDLYRGVTFSLSHGGLGVLTDVITNIELNDRVNVMINSNTDHGSVQVKGRIVNLKKEQNFERLALEFDGQNEFLTQFLENRIPSF